MKHFISPGFLACLVFITLVGCVPHTNMMTSTPSQLTATTTRIPATPTNVIPLTATPTPISTPTIVFQPTNTLTSSATATPKEICPERETGLVSDFLSQGKIIFIESEWYLDPDYLYSFSSPDMGLQPFMKDLSQSSLGDFHVSPNGNWLAFGQEIWNDQQFKNYLVLTTWDSADRVIIPWDEENWSYVIHGWLADNQYLLIGPKYDLDTRRRDEIIVFNPFTNQQQRVKPSFTYPEGKFVFDNWKYVGNDVVYDPTMKRVVYLEDNTTMVLWDVENEIGLWRFTDPILMQSKIPTWSPDGSLLTVSEFVGDLDDYISDDGEFYINLISRDGDEKWRSEPYPDYDQWFQSMVFHWSPDSRYL